MKKELTSRQISMVLFISIIALKFLVFPALISKYSKRDSYLVVFFFLLIEISLIFVTLLIMKQYPNLTFKDIISSSFGKTFSKVIYFILFIYFLFKTLFLIKETHNYFIEAIFDELPWIYFIIPLLTFLMYVMTKTISPLSKSIEIMFWFIIVSIGISVIAPINNTDLLNIFPIFENGITPTFLGMFYSVFSFGDYLVLVLFMGKVKFEKGTIKKVMSYMTFCLVFVTVFYIVFIAIFENSGINHILAINDISVRNTYPYSQEKLDWLAVFIWTITLLFQTGLYALITKNCFVETFETKNLKIPIIIISILLFVMSMLLYFNLELVLKISSSTPFVICALTIQAVIPIILIIASIILKFKKAKVGGAN